MNGPPRFGGAAQHPLLEQIREAIELRVVLRQHLGVARREARHFRLRDREIAAETQCTAIGQGNEIRERAFDDAQPALDQAQVADHLGLQQADRVAGARVDAVGRRARRQEAEIAAVLADQEGESGVVGPGSSRLVGSVLA